VGDADPVHRSSTADAGVASARGNLALRIGSALVLAPLALVSAYVGGIAFAVFWSLAAIAVLWEWIGLVAGPNHRLMFSACGTAIAVAGLVDWRGRPIAAVLLVGLGALAAAIFAPGARRGWIMGGIGYAGVMLMAPMLLRADDAFGFIAMLLLFAIVWTTDVLGYFAGRAIGGPKLMPAVSPKKTWSGALAGTAGAVVVAVAVTHWFGDIALAPVAGVALLLSVVAQGGDLFESWIKRHFGAKDASQLIPGHGGVMDRLDGFWAAALVGAIIGLTRGGFDTAARGLLVW
jgi:phosphatidate cytidylyltransferase